MAFNGKYTTFVGVVDAAFRDSGLDFIDYEAAVEWTAELIGLIGTPYTLVEKVTNGINGAPSAVTVADYRAPLPGDLETFVSVRKVELNENNEIISSYPMIEATDLFHFTPSQIKSGLAASFNPTVNLDEFDPSDETFIASRNQYEIEADSVIGGVGYEYKLDAGYVYTNFDSGYVEVAYRGFPIDSDGYPLIPDDEKFRQALKFHIIYKCDWKFWRRNPSPQNKSIVNDSEQQRDFYVAAARTKSHIPSIDQMESMKNAWLRSGQKINEHSTGFNTLNKPERRRNNTSRRRGNY